MKNTIEVTPHHIDDILKTANIEYQVIDNKMTICIIKLPSKFIITGISSAADTIKFDKVLTISS